MAARRPARRRPRHASRRYRAQTLGGAVGGGFVWTCAVIFMLGVALVALGGWGLLHSRGRGTVAFGFGTSIVLGALLIVFAALLPWLADGPVRIGPLAVTLRIRRGRRRRAGRGRR